MNYNKFRRGRSPPHPPPFDYDDAMRPIPNHGELGEPYHMAMIDRPNRIYPNAPPHPMEMPPMHIHPHHHIPQPHPHRPFIEDPGQKHKNYTPNFNDHHFDRPSPSSSYIGPMGHGDVPMLYQHNSVYPNEPRSSSPPYKILCITNINQKIGDETVKDALTSDFSRFGDISVSVCHDNGERLAYIYFKNCEDAREARQFKTRTIFFDRPIDIEPIYEPIRGAVSPTDLSPQNTMIRPSGPHVYSPRRRSMSPPKYPRDMTDSVAYRAQAPHHIQASGELAPPPLMYSQHRGPSPVNYSPIAHGGYPHSGRSPPPLIAPAHYDRRGHHGAHNHYRSPHMTSPYSSPTHEQYRSSYRSPPDRSPYAAASPVAHPHERAFIPSRSPHHEPYYPIEPRGPQGGRPVHSQHHSSSRSSNSSQHAPPSSHSRQLFSHSSHRGQPIGPRHHNFPPDPPARFMSREFRRERFGTDYYPHEHDDSRPSRVLLVNNLDATKTEKDLRETFEPFGSVEDMEIKNIAPDISSALIKFSSMDGAYKAKTANNGRHIGNLRCRIVYGKVNGSKRLWIGGLGPSTTVSSMEYECGRYGDIATMDYTSGRPYCYVEYETANQAQFAAHHLRTTLTPAPERKVRIEFVDPDRSEKLVPRLDSETGSKSRATNESAFEIEASHLQTPGMNNQKRSVSPVIDSSVSKRLCQIPQDMPTMAASTFKQERLAVVAAKARTSSTTSSSASHPVSDKSDKVRDVNDCNELNNNSDRNKMNNGNFPTPYCTPQIENEQSDQAPSLEKLSQCSSIREIVRCCSVSWPGQIALRNFIFPSQIYMCSGQKQVLDRYLSRPSGSNGDSSSPLLRITQRWRLHPQPKLEEVKRRMQHGNLGVLILVARQENPAPIKQSAISSGVNQHSSDTPAQQQQTTVEQNGELIKPIENTVDKTENRSYEESEAKGATNNEIGISDGANSTTTQGVAPASDQAATCPAGSPNQTRPLRNLISYLEQKDAAGVVSLRMIDSANQKSPVSEDSSKLLYAFPPGDFALNFLKRKALNLLTESTRDEYLLGIIVSGNVECAKV